MTFKLVSEVVGRNVRERIFVGRDEDHLALAGELVFSLGEAARFEAMMGVAAASSSEEVIWETRTGDKVLVLRLPKAAVPVPPPRRALDLTWTCHVCGDERPDAQISVHTIDRSAEAKLPAGTCLENIRYCNDRASCSMEAPHVAWLPTRGRPRSL